MIADACQLLIGVLTSAIRRTSQAPIQSNVKSGLMIGILLSDGAVPSIATASQAKREDVVQCHLSSMCCVFGLAKRDQAAQANRII
jgi:hypothetical protein